MSNLLIIKNLESRIFSFLLYSNYRNSHPFAVFFEMCDIYSIRRHPKLRHEKEPAAQVPDQQSCLFASIHSFNVVEVMIFQFFPFQLESICY